MKKAIIILFIVISVSKIYSDEDRRTILILNSFHQGYHWTDRIMEGILSSLKNDSSLDLHIEYMDAKRIQDDFTVETLTEMYLHKYKKIPIDVIISTDDPALDLLLEYGEDIFPGVPVVFSGINDFMPERIEGRTLYTGVYEEYDIPGTVAIIKKLHPGIKVLPVILDATASGKAFMNRIRRAEPFLPNDLKIDYLVNLTSEELRARLKEFPVGNPVLWGIYLITGDGIPLSVRQSIELVKSANHQEIYCLWDVVGLGAIGGKVTNPVFQGEYAAAIALQIIEGRHPDEIMPQSPPMENLFDYKEIRGKDIKVRDLPDNATFRNQPFSGLWKYKRMIVTTLVFIILLLVIIFILVMDIQRRRKAERSLMQTQQLLLQSRKMDALGQLAGGIAHDFNNLLTGIIAAVSIIKNEERMSDLFSRSVEIIQLSSSQASELCRKLMDFSKKESLELNRLDVHTLIDDTVKILDQTLRSGLEIVVKNNAVDSNILGNRSAIQNIILNLGINASHAISDGGRITIETADILLEKKYCSSVAFDISPGMYLQIKITDTGKGIPPSQLEHIFDPFLQPKKKEPVLASPPFTVRWKGIKELFL